MRDNEKGGNERIVKQNKNNNKKRRWKDFGFKDG